jgi:hypothetical protein
LGATAAPRLLSAAAKVDKGLLFPLASGRETRAISDLDIFRAANLLIDQHG